MKFRGIDVPDDTPDLRTSKGVFGIIPARPILADTLLRNNEAGGIDYPAVTWVEAYYRSPSYAHIQIFRSVFNITQLPNEAYLPEGTVMQQHIYGARNYLITKLKTGIIVNVHSQAQYVGLYQTRFHDGTLVRYVLPAIAPIHHYWF